MANTTSLRADIKMIVRDPILVLFFILPIFTAAVIKLIVEYLSPMINDYIGLELTRYSGYILAFGILMTPLMLGTVAGFLMIDERDSRIQELISVTPVGYLGYISNRLMLPFLGSMLYAIVTHFILSIHYVEALALLLVCILAGIQGVLVGYLLHKVAKDKVQGLTYAKGFGIFTVLALADVLNIRWFSTVAGITPFYWLTKLIVDFSVSAVFTAIIIHMVYLFAISKLK